MPEDTLKKIAAEVHSAVAGLTELIEREYASRSEIDAKYTRKEVSKRRFVWVVGFILASLFLSYFAIVTTVSACFLGGDSKHKPYSVCKVIPGYSDAMKQNEIVSQQFAQLRKITTENDERIDRLERMGNVGKMVKDSNERLAEILKNQKLIEKHLKEAEEDSRRND